jgi:cytochrome P450
MDRPRIGYLRYLPHAFLTGKSVAVLSTDFNFPAFLRNPYPRSAELRGEAPIYPLMPGVWLTTRYEDADRILRDPRFGKDFLAGVAHRYGADVVKEPPFQMVNRFMLLMNPPEHTRLRARRQGVQRKTDPRTAPFGPV